MEDKIDEIDELFINYFNKDIHIPEIITDTIKYSMNYNNKKSHILSNIKRAIITIISILTLTGGMVFAKDIIHFIHNFFNTNPGIDTAIENGYIETPLTDYVESSNIKIKTDYLLMDDNNLDFSFLVTSNENIDLENIEEISFKNMIITDENNSILYSDNKNLIEEYYASHNMNYNSNEFITINSGCNYYIKSKSKESLNIIYNFYADKYPKSKKLNIKFTEINLIGTKNNIITGNWEINLQIPEKFYNRDSLIYNVKSSNEEKINVINAVITDTGMNLELNTKLESNNNTDMFDFIKMFIDENDDNETKQKKINELNIRLNEDNSLKSLFDEYLYKDLFTDIYIINENNDIFYPVSINDQNKTYTYYNDGNVCYSQTFSLTKYDATDNLKLYFKYLEKNIVIELKK